MKPTAYLAALLLVLGLPALSEAACDTDGIVLFPRPGSVIPTNAELILEGRGAFAERVGALVGKQVYLRTDTNETVAAEVRKGWKSEMGRVAVKLAPRGGLKPNGKYTLMLEQELPGVTNLDRRAASTPFWRTGAGPDKQRPTWERRPAPAEGRYFVDDGKVHREVRLNMVMQEESPTYVVISLKRARGTAATQTYFAALDGSLATLGHDGCSGSFIFDDGRAYFATVEGFDAAGNRAPPVKKLELHAPQAMVR